MAPRRSGGAMFPGVPRQGRYRAVGLAHRGYLKRNAPDRYARAAQYSVCFPQPSSQPPFSSCHRTVFFSLGTLAWALSRLPIVNVPCGAATTTVWASGFRAVMVPVIHFISPGTMVSE